MVLSHARGGCQGHVQGRCTHPTLAEGGAQPPTMSMLLVPMGMDWVAATSVGWS